MLALGITMLATVQVVPTGVLFCNSTDRGQMISIDLVMYDRSGRSDGGSWDLGI